MNRIGMTPPTGIQALTQSVNRTMARQRGGEPSQAIRMDTVTISKQGRQHSILDGLMQQKQGLMDKKKSLMEDAKKNGTDISEQMKSLNEQLADLDTQIAQATIQDGLSQMNKKEKDSEDEPKTVEEAKQAQLNQVMDLAVNIDSVQTLQSVGSSMERKANVLKAEIEQDGSVGSGTVLKSKQEEVAKLESRANMIASQAGEMLIDASGQIAKDQETIVKPEDSKENEEEESASAVETVQTEEE